MLPACLLSWDQVSQVTANIAILLHQAEQLLMCHKADDIVFCAFKTLGTSVKGNRADMVQCMHR